MKVDNISTAYQAQTVSSKTTKVDEKQKESFQDQLTLSKEAIQLTKDKTNSRAVYLEEIKSRVKNGYYDQNTVIDKVADSILTHNELGS